MILAQMQLGWGGVPHRDVLLYAKHENGLIDFDLVSRVMSSW